MLSIGRLLNQWMLISKNVEEQDVMESQLSASSVRHICTTTKPQSTIDIATISVYSYWDTLHAISGASPDKYAPALKHALPVIKMAEAPWTCRRIPILSYYNKPPDPSFTCGNCDVCFATDSGLPYQTNIEEDVERIQGQFKGRQLVTRTELGKKFGFSQRGQRVVEYLAFKGILRESPYTNKHGVLNCRLTIVSSKVI